MRSVQSPQPDGFTPGVAMSPAATTTFWSLPMKHPRGDQVFVDTSALHAVLDADDEVHAQARTAWRELIQAGAPLVTSSCVCVETTSLVQARLGMDAVCALYNDLLPVVTVVVIDDAHHTNAVATLLGVNRRDLSLVDCSSFEMMRQRGISTAFAFDRHFAQQGFRLISYPPDR